MQLLKWEEIPLQPGEVQKDGARRPVRATYTVTKAGEKTKRDGEVYGWPSLKLAAKDEWLQEEILCQTLVGFLGHPPDLIDNKGKNWGSNPFVLPKILIPEALWADEDSQEIRSTVRYLPNKAGLDASDDIRAGKELAVSMVSYKRCNDEKYCEILKICGFDQVSNPNMPSATLLSYQDKDSADQCDCHLNSDSKTHCNNCKNSADGFRSAQTTNGDTNNMKFKYKDKELLLNKDQLAIVQGKDMMELREVLGQAKGYGVTQEGTVWLEYWCAALDDMRKQLAGSVAADSADAAIMSADSDKKFLELDEISKTVKAVAATKDGQGAAILNSMASQLSAFRSASAVASQGGGTRQDNPSANSGNGQPQQDAAYKALEAQVASIAASVNAFSQNQATAQAQKDAEKKQAEIFQAKKDGIEKLFSGDTITFNADGKGEAIVYQKKAFHPQALQAVKDGAMTAGDLVSALLVAEVSMDGLSKANAGDYLKGRGYPGSPSADTEPKGKTTSRPATGKDATIADHPAFAKMKEAQDAYMRQNNWKEYERSQTRDSALVREKKNDLLKFNMPAIEATLAKIDQASEEKRSRGKDAADEISLDDFMKQWPVQSQKDSAAPILNNATNAIILPTLSAFMMYQQFEPCDAMNLYRGVTKEGLVPGIPTSSPGWGRIFNFGQEFGDVPSGDDPYVHLNERGTQVFEEIGLETTRQEFVAQDYGLVIRIGRGDALAMLSGWPPYDVLARLKFRAEQYLNRMRNARMYRALFDAADQVGAIARSESVQLVAASGAGPRDYIGEYVVKVGDAAVVLGGKSFGGVGSNIDAVIRVRGSQLTAGIRTVNTTGALHYNVPIARNYQEDTHSSFGIISKRNVCPASLTIGGTAKVQGTLAVVNGVQMIVGTGAQFAIDQDGFFVLAEGAGHGADPTSPAIVTAYYEVTNFIHMNVAPDLDDDAKFYNKKLYQFADAVSVIRSAPNYGMADTVLMSDRVAINMAKASKFDKQESPNGTNLSPFDSGWNRLQYRGINFVGTVDPLPFGDHRSLILQSGYAAAAMWMDGFAQPYRAQKANLLNGGQIEILPQLLTDTLTTDCIGVPIMRYPDTHSLAGQVVNFPFMTVINYGNLPSQSN